MKQKTTKILNALNDAGQFNKVAWRSILKTRKDFPGLVEKVVCAVVSAGTDYANRKSIKEAIENGERDEVGATTLLPVRQMARGGLDRRTSIERNKRRSGIVRVRHSRTGILPVHLLPTR